MGNNKQSEEKPVQKDPIENFNQRRQPMSARSYAIISAIGFILAIVAFYFFYTGLSTGIDRSRMYFIILLISGIFVAAFLFGAMRSYATYRGRNDNSVLSLGGPVVAGALVVFGGFKMVPPEDTNFMVKVQIECEEGVNKKDLIQAGVSIQELEMKSKNIGEDLQAVFSDIDAKYLNKRIHFSLNVKGYEFCKPDSGYVLVRDGFFYICVKRDASLSEIHGMILNDKGDSAEGITVLLLRDSKISTVTDKFGQYTLVVPTKYQNDSLILRVIGTGYNEEQFTSFAGSQDIPQIRLTKR